MPFGLQPTHLVLILVVALLIFGPARLPEIGRSTGKMLGEFRSTMREAEEGPTTLPNDNTAKSQSIELTCRNCNKQIQPGKFCPECGAAQQAE
ncbi:MAG: twin-arginine translocase TatA/TatE family subunit [Chloroflexi bacterium]|nr:twin-arginine translocase TatA/TatE family subunit [Chloroflexota bacterium]